jgi:antitoxin (DNA-binding transcriptional repressor) of toxin-antitoxin stability system
MTVRRVDVTDATESLATYVRKVGAGPVVVTDAGQPVAALVILENTDLETVSLSTDPEFMELIQSSRASQTQRGGLSSAEMRRRLKDEVHG